MKNQFSMESLSVTKRTFPQFFGERCSGPNCSHPWKFRWNPFSGLAGHPLLTTPTFLINLQFPPQISPLPTSAHLTMLGGQDKQSARKAHENLLHKIHHHANVTDPFRSACKPLIEIWYRILRLFCNCLFVVDGPSMSIGSFACLCHQYPLNGLSVRRQYPFEWLC